MCLDATATLNLHGKPAALTVQRHPCNRYWWIVTLDTGDGRTAYRVTDTVADGYLVTRIGTDGPTYRVHIGDRGAGCSCADSRYRRRECRHCVACREVARRW